MGALARRRRVSVPALSVAGRVHSVAISHVSQGLPTIPDGRVSRVRFWPWLSFAGLPSRDAAQAAARIHRCRGRFACDLSPTRRVGTTRLDVRMPPDARTAKCPGPLRTLRALPLAPRRPASRRRALPRLGRYYGPMRQTKTLPPTSVSLYGGSSQVVAAPCWELALPDVISAILA